MLPSEPPRTRSFALVTVLALTAAMFVATTAPAVAGATITVTSLTDSTGGPACTLRDAIDAANTDAMVGGCTAGAGADTIGFGSLSGSILLGSALPAIASDLRIDGTGAAVTVDGQNAVRGFEIDSGTVAIAGLTIDHGSAVASEGGGIDVLGGDVTVTDTTISNARAQNGGGFATFGGNATFTRDTFTGNVSNNLAGAIDSAAVTTITNSTFMGNSAAWSGGAINDIGAMTITDSTFKGNTGSQNAGAIFFYAGSTLTVTGSTFTTNHAYYGAAVYGYDSSSSSTFINDTFSGNKANQGAGAIYNNGPMTIASTTIANNKADYAGGVFNSGTGSISASIVAGNTKAGGVPDDCAGAFTSGGYNIIGAVGSCTGFTDGVNNDRVGTSGTPVDAQLKPLRSDGGPTQTLGLLPTSPALDKVPAGPSCPATDQRGVPRPQGSACEIGAYEVRSYPATVALDKPIVYYRLGEATGPTAFDVSGHGRNLNYSAAGNLSFGQPGALVSDPNTAVTDTGKGKVAAKTGVTYLPAGSSTRTIEVWYRSAKAENDALLRWGTNLAGQGFGLIVQQNALVVDRVGGTSTFSTAANLQDGNWHQLAITYDGTTLRAYVDGVSVGTQAAALATASTSDLVVGAWFSTAWHAVTGTVDEVAIYPKALSAAKIQSHYWASGR